MDILPKLLDAAISAEYQCDLGDPDAVFRDPSERAEYLRIYGNICFETQALFRDFPCSSDQ